MVSKLNLRFVFVQAFHVGKDEVSSYANPRFANYRRALQRLGLLHGAYLRCHPNANAETSIKKFWAVYTPQAGDILPTLPPTWSKFSFWQYAENLHGNGVEGTYDGDYFNGSEADLGAYLVRKQVLR